MGTAKSDFLCLQEKNTGKGDDMKVVYRPAVQGAVLTVWRPNPHPSLVCAALRTGRLPDCRG